MTVTLLRPCLVDGLYPEVGETVDVILRCPGQPRALSLGPSICIAAVGLDQVVANQTERYAMLRGSDEPSRMESGSHLTLISGSSQTADIELCMVPGAYGPRVVHIFVVTGTT